MSTAAIPFPPVLREGDRLTAREFLRRWEAIPELKNAESIDGIVFMASPVSYGHGSQRSAFNFWLSLFAGATPGCAVCSDTTWVMGPSEVPQPDLAMRILPQFGGQSKDSGHYPAGAPELIVEISGSSTSRDLGVKLDSYRRAGVREYLTVLLNPKQIIWRQLVRNRYKEVTASADGLLKSRVFPGLWLDPAAVWDANRSLRPAVEFGLQSPEHALFLHTLRAAEK
jgi:Uma2 family endonuclease